MHKIGAKEGAEWTFARHREWAECPRKYWFDFVAPHDGNAPEADRARLNALKLMVSLRYLKGLAVHTQIRLVVPRLLAGERVDADGAARAVATWLDDWWEDGKEKIPELHNGAAIPREAFERIKTEAQDEMCAFLEKRWAEITALGLEAVEVEKTARFTVDRAPVLARLDLVGRRKDGGTMVVDWKTGEDDPAYESEFQMSVYALAANEAGFAGGRKVEAMLVFLKSGVTKAFRFSRPDFEATREKIRKDLALMEPPPAREQAPAKPSAAVCLACNFATVCDVADLSGAKKGPWT